MTYRTDLAMEKEKFKDGSEIKGVEKTVRTSARTRTTLIRVKTDEAARVTQQPKGSYITVEMREFSGESELFDERFREIKNAVLSLLPQGEGTVLVVGLGNENITPDALGPECVNSVFSTRHISSVLAEDAGLGHLNSVCAVATGVLGQTGIETGEIIRGITELVKPRAVIVIDALACSGIERLCRTVQITDTGIVPGSGVGNSRKEISRNTLGVPVIAIGVPTVIDAVTVAGERNAANNGLSGMMVTPREIDSVIHRAARLISLSVNSALQPHIDPEILLGVV